MRVGRPRLALPAWTWVFALCASCALWYGALVGLSWLLHGLVHIARGAFA